MQRNAEVVLFPLVSYLAVSLKANCVHSVSILGAHETSSQNSKSRANALKSRLIGGKHLKCFSPKMLKIVHSTFPSEGIKDEEKNCRR
jgi:hypothetical protein